MSKTSKEDVLVNTPIEETVAKTAEVLYGADGDASTGADSSVADSSAGTDSLKKSKAETCRHQLLLMLKERLSLLRIPVHSK